MYFYVGLKIYLEIIIDNLIILEYNTCITEMTSSVTDFIPSFN